MKESRKPLVSVVITTYNRLELLERAINSVLLQDYPSIELIISDDCSDVDIPTLIRRKRKSTSIPIFYRRNNCNSGACFTRNEGIKMASGFFITGLDDDDEFALDRVSYLVKNYNKAYSFVATNTEVITKKGNKTHYSEKKDKVINLYDCLWENVVGTQVLTEKSRFINSGGFDTDLTSAQDCDMWVRLIKDYGPALRLKKAKYILHTEHEEGRISSSTNKLKGLSDFHKKHENLMSLSQIKYSRFKLLLWSKSITFSEILKLDLSCILFILRKKLKLI
ncbi:glycosyltransferase [Pseudoalteromonas sp. AS71]|uniref:glycosyltransferase n=1 Tax=Pseudoalteromonas sp. AS71 TaxID=3135777 RepID=UPI00316D39BA